MDFLLPILIAAIPVLFAITLHEVAHGYVAKLYGDVTAASLGRLSLNPLKHISLIGTVIVPIVLIKLTGVGFGWAKPVPVRFDQLNNPKKDMVKVAAAGPFANFLMLVFWLLIAKLVNWFGVESSSVSEILLTMCTIGVFINLILIIVNLIPVPPLDGGRVLSGLVSNQTSMLLRKIEPYGIFIVFGLIYYLVKTGYLDASLYYITSFLNQIFGLAI